MSLPIKLNLKSLTEDHILPDVLREFKISTIEEVQKYFEKKGSPRVVESLRISAWDLFRFPFIKQLTDRITEVINSEAIITSLKRRIENKMRVRSLIEPFDIYWTLSGVVFEIILPEVEEIRLKWDDVYKSITTNRETYVHMCHLLKGEKREEEIIKDFETEAKPIKESKPTKKAETRNANKQRDAKKREREEFERKQAEAFAEKAKQDARKKQLKAQKKSATK